VGCMHPDSALGWYHFQRPQWTPVISMIDPVVNGDPRRLIAHIEAASNVLPANARRKSFCFIFSPSFRVSLGVYPEKVPISRTLRLLRSFAVPYWLNGEASIASTISVTL